MLLPVGQNLLRGGNPHQIGSLTLNGPKPQKSGSSGMMSHRR